MSLLHPSPSNWHLIPSSQLPHSNVLFSPRKDFRSAGDGEESRETRQEEEGEISIWRFHFDFAIEEGIDQRRANIFHHFLDTRLQAPCVPYWFLLRFLGGKAVEATSGSLIKTSSWDRGGGQITRREAISIGRVEGVVRRPRVNGEKKKTVADDDDDGSAFFSPPSPSRDYLSAPDFFWLFEKEEGKEGDCHSARA